MRALSVLSGLSLVYCQSQGDKLVNWLLPDIDVYYEAQPLTELRGKLNGFKTGFSDAEAVHEGTCDESMANRFALMVDNGIRYGFWGNTTIRSVYADPMQMFEILAYSGMPVDGIPLFETSYERVSTIEYNSTYLELIYSTTQASLVDGFYQWSMKCQDGMLYLKHRKVARANYNTAKILQWYVPKLDDTSYDEGAEDLTEFLGVNNAASTQNMVDGLLAILLGAAPCSQNHCWWQGLGPGPAPPTP